MLLRRKNVLGRHCVQVSCHDRLHLVNGRHKSLIVKLCLLSRQELATTFGGQKRRLGWWVRVRAERGRTIRLEGLMVKGRVLKEGGDVLLNQLKLLVGHEALLGARSEGSASREYVSAGLD